MSEETRNLLLSIKIPATEVEKILKNKKLTERIVKAISDAGLTGGCEQPTGALIQKLCQKENPHATKVAQYIGNGKIATGEQLDAAIQFTLKTKEFSDADFDKAAGVGVVVTPEQIVAAVSAVIAANQATIQEKGKKASLGIVLKSVKTHTPEMQFASSAKITEEVKKQFEAIPDSEPAAKPKAKPKAKAAPKKDEQKKVEESTEEKELDFKGIVASFPSPQDNAMGNSKEILEEHLKITDGNYMTRFPPEPNGWIHIGHAKAMYLDFGLAEMKKGKCYMRFDDTNPAKEKDEFIEGIKKDVNWMGFNWWKITHTSDYFQQLYEFAIHLIKEGLAYVCHQTKEEIKLGRENHTASPWRDRPVAESLREFELMKCGYYAPSEATLRLKMDITSANPNMYDQVAYRIIYNTHPRTHDQWCIYPTYDYSHCVIDSIEHITHSLCTLEFENRRESYYWVLDALKIYKPFVWEFSRLNLTYTVMSKRRLQALVYGNLVDGWDDPRMPTVAGLRRRGFTASAIRNFVKGVGFTRNVTTCIPYDRLEYVQRSEFDETAKRAFCVIDPIKVTIQGIDSVLDVEAPFFPKNPEAGTRKMKLSSTVYIDRDDFREVPEKGFKRLTPVNPVGLKYANVQLKVVQVIKKDNVVTELVCERIECKAQAYIHWVSEGAKSCEVRLYNQLFKSEDPMSVQGDWRDDLNKDSKVIIQNALVEPALEGSQEYDHFQFERKGYFVVDQDSTAEKLVFNRTLELKSSF
ncbi:glutaminyl-tRNA synthetase family protein [Tritrichomonas foetus]|uniref:glutamine--tRNA ligase n=1 Tax=Tritrichomonas foetus TaxID=1144522 RepID=A0A1J4KWI5_9EUKA|nr:glutaminyl-tRNA synthetase family protein [Tritrichomonas foetus]|eukprot:OHT15522.1 glutaminyl-tRNA synthetase family protein [Tritrichomonas foetus]